MEPPPWRFLDNQKKFTTCHCSFTLRDLLRDSVESFDIKQRELAWTAISYALYLPPQRRWSNRYKESFTFDDVANALMQTPCNVAGNNAYCSAVIHLGRKYGNYFPAKSCDVRQQHSCCPFFALFEADVQRVPADLLDAQHERLVTPEGSG